MNNLDMARSLMGSKRNNPGQTTTAYGRATSDSENGFVMVDMGGDTVSPDDDQSIECETTFKVYTGDEVIVSLIGADGSGKTPIVAGVVGRGDEMQLDIDSVKDVKNYFWTNDRGAHVTTSENSVIGNNILLDADSLDIRYGLSNDENDQTVFASFGREVTIGNRDETQKVGNYSQVFGQNCSAKAPFSSASGYNTIAGSSYQTVSGRNNVEDELGHYVEIVGNGAFPSEDEIFTSDGSTLSFTLLHAPKTIISIDVVNSKNPCNVEATWTGERTSTGGYLTELSISEPLDVDLPIKLVTGVMEIGPKIYNDFISYGTILAGDTSVFVDHGEDVTHTLAEQYLTITAPYYVPEEITDEFSISGNILTLTGETAYWADHISGIKYTISYDYNGIITYSNARTLDWDGNETISGNYFTPYGRVGEAVLLATDDSGNTSPFQTDLLYPERYSSFQFLILLNWSSSSDIQYVLSERIPLSLLELITDLDYPLDNDNYSIRIVNAVHYGSQSYRIYLDLSGYFTSTYIGPGAYDYAPCFKLTLTKARNTYSFRKIHVFGII